MLIALFQYKLMTLFRKLNRDAFKQNWTNLNTAGSLQHSGLLLNFIYRFINLGLNVKTSILTWFIFYCFIFEIWNF